MRKKIVFEKVIEKNFDDFISLVKKLADYENQNPPDVIAECRLRKDALSSNPRFEAYLVKEEGKSLGYVIFYMTYSSYLALPTLYIEDIFVLEIFRRKGIGKKMFQFCVHLAKERGCGRVEWCVYDWNSLAIKFYENLNATRMGKTYYRLNSEQMKNI
jgi:GNAT superfamily N-acetyltransferase